MTKEDGQNGFGLEFHVNVRLTRAAWPRGRKSKGDIVSIVGTGSRFGCGEFTIGASVNVALLTYIGTRADIRMERAIRIKAVTPG